MLIMVALGCVGNQPKEIQPLSTPNVVPTYNVVSTPKTIIDAPSITPTASNTNTPIVDKSGAPTTTVSANGKTVSIGETWDIGSGYTLTVVSIDSRSNPKQVWFEFFKDGARLDSTVSNLGNIYQYESRNHDTVFQIKIIDIYAGPKSDMVTFAIIYKYP